MAVGNLLPVAGHGPGRRPTLRWSAEGWLSAAHLFVEADLRETRHLEIALAIETGCDAADIGLTIHPHPTLSETVAAAADAFEGTLTDLYIPKK